MIISLLFCSMSLVLAEEYTVHHCNFEAPDDDLYESSYKDERGCAFLASFFAIQSMIKLEKSENETDAEFSTFTDRLQNVYFVATDTNPSKGSAYIYVGEDDEANYTIFYTDMPANNAKVITLANKRRQSFLCVL